MAYNIAVIPGDGIGPEVIREGLKVLGVVAKKYDIRFEYETFDWGGDRYLATGEVMPGNAVEIMQRFDAIYLGAVGHPDVKAGSSSTSCYSACASVSINTSICGLLNCTPT